MHVRSHIPRLILALALLVALLPLSPAKPAAAAEAQSPEPYLLADGTLSVPVDFSGSFDLEGWDVSLDEVRGVRLQPAAAIAGQWSSLGGAGTGLNGTVYDFEFNGGVLYAGGDFTDAGGDADADRIAKFESGAWSSLGGAGTGLNGTVRDIEFDGGVLYAGGSFTDAGGDVHADRIAKFSGGAWSSLAGVDTGLNAIVLDIEFNGGVLYAAGNFTDASGNLNADRIAQFNGAAWISLGGADPGLNGSVHDIEFNGGVLYAGGDFTDAGGDVHADRIAQFSGGAWSSLGGAGTGLNFTVLDIEINGGVLYAAGLFSNAGGDADADRIAKFESGAWSSLATGLDPSAYEIEFNESVIYAGGAFFNAGGDADADNIAQFSGGAWSSLGGSGTRLNAIVLDIEINGGVLYAGGSFTDAGGDADADRIAQFGLPLQEEEGAADNGGNPSTSTDIAASGTTTLDFGRIIVSVPASAVAGLGDCRLGIEAIGTSGQFGFTLNDTVWDVDIVCDGVNQHIFFAPISVCIRPDDGMLNGKQVFHRGDGGGSFSAMPVVDDLAGYVCAETRVLSLFTLGSVSLPDTGFAPGVTAERGAEVVYAATGLTLDLPALDVSLPIVGVPQDINGWDVSWLGSSAGFLQGTAFPTFAGNTVITGHVWSADNQPGPFAGLESLRHGDRFSISAWGSTYTYEVRANELYSPNALSPLGSDAYDWVTLITCEGFDEASGEYAYRRVVRAVLVEVGN